MKVRCLTGLLTLSLCCFTACSNRNSTVTSSGTGVLYLATQSNSSLEAFSVNLGSGGLSLNGSAASTGSFPTAIALAPSLNAIFVANKDSNDVSRYTVNSDGSLTAASGTTNAGTTPMGLAVDPAGKFLFVANQGSNDVSVFSIDGTSLSEVAGAPFTTIPAGTTLPTAPMGVVVSASGNFLYVANSLTGTVAAFSIAASGALMPLGTSPYPVGTAPTGMALTPGGAFLYVANSGSNTVSAFSICDKVVTSCADPNNPDGRLTVIPGPASQQAFPAGQGPVAVAADPSFNFLYVLDKGSNQVSLYSFGSGTGALSTLPVPTVSTGATPVSFVILSGATGSNRGNTTTNPTDYVYVANNGSSTLSVFTLSTSSGILFPLGQSISTQTNPSAVAAD
jgi:6-phosphogluconolactonase